MGWITDRLAEMAAEKQQVLPQPSIPQAEPDTSRDALIEQARASTETMRPASLQELGITPGQDFAAVLSRRHAPATEITPDDTLTPQQRGMLAKLGTQAGEYGPANQRAKAARDNAALVAEQGKAWTITEDTLPRRVDPSKIAGHTPGRQ